MCVLLTTHVHEVCDIGFFSTYSVDCEMRWSVMSSKIHRHNLVCPSSLVLAWHHQSLLLAVLGIIFSTIAPYIKHSVVLIISSTAQALTSEKDCPQTSMKMLAFPHSFFPLSSKTTCSASIRSVNASLLSSNNFLPSSPSARRISNWLTRREVTVRSSIRASCLPMQP